MLRSDGYPPDARVTAQIMTWPHVPLHHERYSGNAVAAGVTWWGCYWPERRHDDGELWDIRCPKCYLKMRLVFALEGGDGLCANGCARVNPTLTELLEYIDGGGLERDYGEVPPAETVES